MLATAGITTGLGLDVDTAIDVADNALTHNWLQAALAAATAGYVAYEAYDIYQIYESDGAEEAAKKLGLVTVEAVVGGAAGKVVFKVGKTVYPTAKAALQAYKEANQGFAMTFDAIAKVAHKGTAAMDAVVKKLAGKGGKGVADKGKEEIKNLLSPPKTVKHHIFNKFRGESAKSQKYRDFFKKHDIDVDAYSIEITETMHRSKIHKAQHNWTTQWKNWIDKNPDASTKEVYQFAGELMDRYGVAHVPIIKY